MVNPTYSYRASDGNTYSGSLEQLRQWSTEGRVRLEDFVTDTRTGQDVLLRDLLYPAQIQPQAQMPNAAGAYPRGFQAAPMMATPANIGKFHWGAFLLNWIWGLNHKKPITLIALVIGFIPFVGGLAALAFSIYIGTQGYLWAWESGRFATVEDFESCQRIWTKWGVGVVIVQVVAVILVFVILAILSQSR